MASTGSEQKRRLRVLHVLGSMNRGGIENGLMNLYRNMDRTDIQFDFALHTYQESHFEQEIYQLGGTIYRLPDPRKQFIAFNKQLKAALRNWKERCEELPQDYPAAVHSHVFHFSGIVLRQAAKESIGVRVAHSHRLESGAKGLRGLYARGMRYLIERFATHRLACSAQAGISLFGNQWNSADSVLPNVIHTESYRAASSKRDELRRGWLRGRQVQGIVILHVGRFIKEKNHSFILDVFQNVLECEPDAILVLAGEGPLMPGVMKEVESRRLTDSVIFLGLCDNIPELIAAADAFIFPSLSEGLGMAAVEAQAGGLPVLASTAVPLETDIGVKRMFRLSLGEGEHAWAVKLVEISRLERPGMATIEAGLYDRKYEIRSLLPTMRGIYEYGSVHHRP